MGAAAAQTAATAQQAQEFSEQYFNEVLRPSVEQQMEIAKSGAAKLEEMMGINISQMKLAEQRYREHGIPAEEAYYRAVQEFSAPEEQERQALAARADIQTAFANQNQQTLRAIGGLGGGPLDIQRYAAARGGAAPMQALIEANAMTRARQAAQTMGLQLKADAANFGRGGQSGILAFGQAGQGNIGAQGGLQAQATGSAIGAAGVPQQGYQTAMQGYGNIANLWGSQANNYRSTEAQSQGAVWGALGQIGGMAAKAAISDIRLKHDLVFAGTDITGVDFYFFSYNDRPGRWLGVIAQQLQKVAPYLVHKIGDYLAVTAPYLPRRIG